MWPRLVSDYVDGVIHGRDYRVIPPTYDSVTLDYEDDAGTGANVTFDGAAIQVITASGLDGVDTKVLVIPAWWRCSE